MNNNSNQFKYKNHGYKIMNLRGGYNSRALNNIFKQCEFMLSCYSRVFVFRIDFHLKEFTADNKLVSAFLTQYKKRLENNYKCKVTYICAREQHKSTKQHYHVAFLLSGHKVIYPNKVTLDCKSEWEKMTSGSVHFPENCYYMIERGNKSTFNPCIRRLSYLVKNFSKNKNGTAKSYLMSRIKDDGILPEHDYFLVAPEETLKNKQRKADHLSFPAHNVLPTETVELPTAKVITQIVAKVDYCIVTFIDNRVNHQEAHKAICVFKPP